MKAHELAKKLLSQPDGEILIETAVGRKECKVVSKCYFGYTRPAEDCLVVVQRHVNIQD